MSREEIDWPAVQRRLAPDDARIAESLRLIHSRSERSSSTSPHAPASVSPRPIAHWVRAVAIVAILQVSIAAGSFLASASVRRQPASYLLAATSLVYAVAAVALMHGLRDTRALSLACFFLTVAAAASQRPIAWLASAGWTLSWIRLPLLETLLPLFLWRFVREFPRIVRLSRSSVALDRGVAVSAGLGVVLLVSNAFARAAPHATPDWLQLVIRGAPSSFYWPLVLGAACVSLFMAGLRLREAAGEERNRGAVLLLGVILGCGPGFLLVLLERFVPLIDAFTSRPLGRFYSDLVVYVPLLSIAGTSAYAVLGKQVLDVRLTIQRALRWQLADRAGRVLLLASGAGLLGCVLVSPRASLAEVLASQPGPALLAGVAAGAVVLGLRRPLLGVMERVLAPNVGLALAAFNRDVAAARGAGEAVAILQDHARRGLLCEGLSVWLCSREGAFIPLTAGDRPLEPGSALACMMSVSAGPMALDPVDPRSEFRWLPAADREWVAASRTALLLPMTGADGACLGVASVPAREDGAPYSEADRLLAAALVSSTALAIQACERQWPTTPEQVRGDEPSWECAHCGRVSADGAAACSCGGTLRPAMIPMELNGRFRVESVLGRGGMGVAYRATDVALNRVVALKTLPRATPDALLRLRREAESMARFVHPNLALIFGLEIWRGVPVLVVEHLAGGTLAQRVGSHLPVPLVLGYGIQVATALAAMHGKSLLHRDVKPSNIGFTEDDVPKLLDFGLARLRDEASDTTSEPRRQDVADPLTRTSRTMGTPRYLSPEAWEGAPASPAQDVWALFVVLYEAIVGAHPFVVEKSLNAVQSDAARRLETERGLAAPVRDLLAAGLEARPDRRITAAIEARVRMESCLRAITQSSEPDVRNRAHER